MLLHLEERLVFAMQATGDEDQCRGKKVFCILMRSASILRGAWGWEGGACSDKRTLILR